MVHKRNIKLEIIGVLLKSQTHIRDIAKKLNLPHTTIFRRLNGLKEENVVDFKNEGRNKIFFLKRNIVSRNYVLQMELYNLIDFIRKEPKLGVVFEEILKEILKETDVSLIVLFGSYAKGIAKKNSDVDIYIETKNRAIKNRVEDIYPKLNVKIGKFDPNSELIQEIIKNHIILKGVEKFYGKSIFGKAN